MSVGRNDPCPCGSGKKYKKCCLAKDEEAKRKEAAPAPIIEPEPETAERKERPKPPPDPRLEAWNARYDEFEAGDYEERIALFNRTLDEPELMDGEMAFEMLNELFEEAATRDERDRYDSLVESLRQRLPKVYEKEAGFLLENRISNALVLKRPELVHTLMLELAALAGKEIDRWDRVETRLAYHGCLNALVEAMRLAWPQVRRSGDIVPWGKDEFSSRAVQYEMLDYVAQSPAPSGDDPVLLERVRFFLSEDFYPDRIMVTADWLAGRTERQWTMDDFKFQPPKPRSRRDWDEEEDEEVDEPDPAKRNLSDLTLQFVTYAHRVEGVPYTKAELARDGIFTFISRRHAGELEYHESMLDSALRSAGKKRGPIKKYNRFDHLLCPDSERLDHYLGELLGLLSYQLHRAAALMESVPAWVRFLQSQGLIDADRRRQTLNELKPLAGTLLKIFEGAHSDTTLREAMKQWPENAKKELE